MYKAEVKKENLSNVFERTKLLYQVQKYINLTFPKFPLETGSFRMYMEN